MKPWFRRPLTAGVAKPPPAINVAEVIMLLRQRGFRFLPAGEDREVKPKSLRPPAPSWSPLGESRSLPQQKVGPLSLASALEGDSPTLGTSRSS